MGRWQERVYCSECEALARTINFQKRDKKLKRRRSSYNFNSRKRKLTSQRFVSMVMMNINTYFSHPQQACTVCKQNTLNVREQKSSRVELSFARSGENNTYILKLKKQKYIHTHYIYSDTKIRNVQYARIFCWYFVFHSRYPRFRRLSLYVSVS